MLVLGIPFALFTTYCVRAKEMSLHAKFLAFACFSVCYHLLFIYLLTLARAEYNMQVCT
jgi:hypothetical protein